MMKYLVQGLAAALSASVLGMASPAMAEFPDHPVTIVVGVQPGGSIDVLARLIGQKLSETWGQGVVVDNRPGASETIGADYVARSKPDGYTLFMASSSHTLPKEGVTVPYDPVKDFASITFVALQPQILAVRNDLGVNSVKELIALAKSKPGALNYGSGGKGTPTYATTVLMLKRTGTEMTNVTYKGGAPTLAGMLNGEIQLMFGSVTTLLEQVKSGKVKALAVSSAARFPGLPDTPTVAEAADLPGFEVQFWFGILAPKGTPADIVTKLNTDLVAAIKSSEVQDKLKGLGYVTVASTPEALEKMMTADMAQWAGLE